MAGPVGFAPAFRFRLARSGGKGPFGGCIEPTSSTDLGCGSAPKRLYTVRGDAPIKDHCAVIPGQTQCRPPVQLHRERAFTLIEVLVVLGIVLVLLSLVLPMARGTVATARSFSCQMSLRSTVYDFTVFADDVLHGPRGSDATDSSFTLASFQDSLYGVDEFWAWPSDPYKLPDARGSNPMRCSEVRGSITVRANAPCDGGGVGPLQNISYGLNIRLHVREITSPAPVAAPVRLSSAALSAAGPSVPLVWDVDAAAAVADDVTPFYSGPSLDSPAVYAGDQYWRPGLRHNRGMNVGFLDGHVASTRRPLMETAWRWGYVPGT